MAGLDPAIHVFSVTGRADGFDLAARRAILDNNN
jgi:hypothetical protein